MSIIKGYRIFPLIIILLITLAPSGSLPAQEVILSGGGDAGMGTGSISFSVGQIAYGFNTGTNGFVIEGAQQPFELQYHIGINETVANPYQFTVFPNPTDNDVILKTGAGQTDLLTCQVYNMNGFLLLNLRIDRPEAVISLRDLAPAAYTLTISENEHALKSFLIIRK